jgi:putative Mg2+ transporter-C (MgtC) family protein
MAMPLHPTLADLALRLILTLAAGGLIGLNRETGGHPAGFRTTLLVALAACVATILANLLLPALLGKGQSSDFVRADVMRLPLGILTGIGFIGGGAILKRGSLVIGITTAATLWMATVIGITLGAGQAALGAVATALTLAVLMGLKPVEARLRRTHRGALSITIAGTAAPLLTAEALGVERLELIERRWSKDEAREFTRYQLSCRQDQAALAQILERLAAEPDRITVHWTRMAE